MRTACCCSSDLTNPFVNKTSDHDHTMITTSKFRNIIVTSEYARREQTRSCL